jgi:hypothetical protein
MSVKSLSEVLEVDKLTENQKTAAFVIAALWPHIYNKCLREDDSSRQAIEQTKRIMKEVKENF